MKRFKGSEVIMYAVALMLVAAGYFNYTTFEQKTEETYSEDVQELDKEYANVGDAVLVSNNEAENTASEENNSQVSKNDENWNQVVNNETTPTSGNANTNETTSQSQENKVAKNTNTNETTNQHAENKVTEKTNSSQTDYYASSKLDRNTMYAEMLSNYEKIINNSSASEAQKSIAAQEISKINNAKNAIMICENLILTKGFENCVVFINDESVNVVVSKSGGLQADGVAIIQNIISREMQTEINNIHISEK